MNEQNDRCGRKLVRCQSCRVRLRSQKSQNFPNKINGRHALYKIYSVSVIYYNYLLFKPIFKTIVVAFEVFQFTKLRMVQLVNRALLQSHDFDSLDILGFPADETG